MSPRASVIIPVHGHAGLTVRCVETIAAQRHATATEIVVVDDASTDETPQALEDLQRRGIRLVVVRHDENLGFAAACNAGAATAGGDLLVFLNNDTVPQPGWLDTLVEHAERHPRAGAVGAKLLYPDGTIQHAGVVIGQDRNPHHIYAGFPGNHAAVSRSRRFQVVTGACLLVRRLAFEDLGGFDSAFVNGHEDVDLCLRLGRAGHEVWYCADSVLVHLESASRGRRAAAAATNGRLYRGRWADVVQPDDVLQYLDDQLLQVRYGEPGLPRLMASPLLASIDERRAQHAEQQLRVRAAQVAELLQQVIELTVEGLDTDLARRLAGGGRGVPAVLDPEHDDELATALLAVRRLVAERRSSPPMDANSVEYRRLVQRVRREIVARTPAGAVVAVISRGDDDLLELEHRTACHFPRDPNGGFAGYHPADDAAALAQLDACLVDGITYLAIPAPSRWWLDHYSQFDAVLRTRHTPVATTHDCTIFELDRIGATRPTAALAGRNV
jgi:GT2 family glycosyltransferase